MKHGHLELWSLVLEFLASSLAFDSSKESPISTYAFMTKTQTLEEPGLKTDTLDARVVSLPAA